METLRGARTSIGVVKNDVADIRGYLKNLANLTVEVVTSVLRLMADYKHAVDLLNEDRAAEAAGYAFAKMEELLKRSSKLLRDSIPLYGDVQINLGAIHGNLTHFK